MEKEHCDSVDSHIIYCSSNYGIQINSRIEWNFVINPSENNLDKLNFNEWPQETELDSKDRRKPKPIDDFEDDLDEINVRLRRIGLPTMTIIEVIALRLYSDPMVIKYNKMIFSHIAGHREGYEWRLDEEHYICLGNKYPTTIHVI